MTKLLDFQDDNPVTPRKHVLMKLHERVSLFINYINFYEMIYISIIY
jgi:hypothetical protein